MLLQELMEQQKQWLKLSFLCPLELAEAASDVLAVKSGSGVEQSPEQDSACVLAGFFAVHDADEVRLVAADVGAALAALFALYEWPAPELERRMLQDEDWATSWQRYFRPFAVVPGLIVRPSWESYAAGPGERVLEMDPGMAFGTGQHASTRGALTLMRQALGALPPEVEQRALDVGTGTGILAMAAALWGMPAVLALDNDPEAVQVAAENVARNGLAAQIRVALTPLAALSGSFALVTANIVHDVLAAMQADLTRLTAQGGFLLLAGILAGGQEANIVRLYGDCGFHLVEARYEDEWAALLLRRG